MRADSFMFEHFSETTVNSEAGARDLDAWVTRLHRAELPVLGGVMRDINRLTRDSSTSVDELTAVILRDAALTAKVLRLSSSAYFNPHGDQEVTTLSRAVMKLGFNGIKAISLSVMLIDSLLRKGAKERMLQWLARGFHAAVQARALVANRSDLEPEDVFISALLLHLGDLAFWSVRGSEATLLESRLGDQRNDEVAERAVLGASLKEITHELAGLWGLSETLREALHDGAARGVAARAVQLGDAVALAAEEGWDSSAMSTLLDEVSAFSGRGLIDLLPELQRNAQEAATVAVSFGANAICPYIPPPDNTPVRTLSKHRADPQLQLKILREMATMIQDGVDANTLFQTVVEGVHRGAGFERVALCLIDPKNKLLQAKHVLGDDAASWREILHWPARHAQENLPAYCFHERLSVWLQPGRHIAQQALVDADLRRQIATDNCVMASLHTGSRRIGVLVADRGEGGEPIVPEQHDSFCHFVQQANMGLAVLAARVARK
jgi:HD-like signal output (HDOD) protein